MSQIETTTEQTLQIAIEAHKLGKLQDAEAGYRAILQIQPKHPHANHNLGLLAIARNRPEVALPLFQIALETNPTQGQFWISYVDALMKDKQFDIARNVLEQGKKRGLAGEIVDALEAQLKSSPIVREPESALQRQPFTFRQQRKKITEKKEKKKKIPANLIHSNPTKSPSQIEVNTLLKHYQTGRYDLVQNDALALTQQYPNHPFAWKVLGAVFQQVGKLQDSLVANQKVLEISPNDAEAHSNLGNTLQDLRRLAEAETSYKKAIAIKPDLAEAHSNLGNTLKEFGRPEEAETSYKKALAIKPDYAEAHSNLGNVLQKIGRLDEAETSYKKAIAIKPGLAAAHSNLGNTLNELGRPEEAETSYKKAIVIKPDLAEAHYNLGVTLKELGRLEEAETSYKKAILIKPNYAEAHSNLGVTLKELGRLEDAFNTAIKSIRIKPTVEAKGLFIAISKKLSIKIWDLALSELVITALLEPWGRPSDVTRFACRLLKADKEFAWILGQSKDDASQANFDDSLLSLIFKKVFAPSALLHAGLISSPIPDAEIEILLTSLRRHLLKAAVSVIFKEDQPQEIPALYCSLAQQCFINEYVYFQTPEEIDESERLRDRLKKALESEQAIPAVWAIAVACYFPLYSIVGVEKLLHQKWPDDVGNVLIQQIQEPLAELNLRGSIPALTSIDNQVSLVVQSQYEEHPYPRWVRLPKDSNKQFLNSYIQSKFRLSAFSRLVDDRNPEVLIAGCGTGQHSIGTSQSFKGAKILAIDLSMASLAYAKRKTIESNIESIEYAQADILKLGSLGRTFDVIESSGVLHHLENPFEGWEVLLSLLRPHGLMRLGFYSELARRDIVSIRGLIDQEGVGSSTKEIRNYRKYLLESNRLEDYRSITNLFDFFSTSMCRDLLFHVQEHRMNLNILARFFKDHDLNFLGFDIDMSVIQSYKRRFPDDSSATNLDNWRTYEEENPDTFIGMYQFWVQKKF